MDVTYSPDKKHVAVEERTSIVIIDTETDSIVHTFSIRKNLHSASTYSGIKWINLDGKSTLFFSIRDMVVRAEWTGDKLNVTKTYYLPPQNGAHASIPNEIEFDKSNTNHIAFVVLNGNDLLIKFDTENGKILWEKPTGIAPYGIVKAAGKLYITNWSGSVPDKNATHTAGVPFGWGKTVAYVDSLTGAVSSGSVSVFNPETGNLLKEIKTGLHPNDIISSPDGEFVYVANGNDDYISVISTKTDEVLETIPVKLMQGNNPYFGDTPNGLSISNDGITLYVSLGMDNAIAVVELGEKASAKGENSESKISGFIPVGAYPGGIAIDESKVKIFVANIEYVFVPKCE
jgi:YVTN family beta-propeller protein